MALLSQMGTLPRVSALRKAAVGLALAGMVGACSGGSNTARYSPSPSVQASPTQQASGSPTGQSSPTAAPPQPVNGAYGVLVSSQAATSYTVSVVGIDGKVVASADASTPAQVSCANAAAAVVPLPVSTSNSRLYFMDAQGVLRFLAPNGDTGRATTVPAGSASQRSMFAVSPDDQRIAVIVDDFTSSGAATRLYVEDLNGGGHHLELYTESGAYTLWPTGWHGTNNLVVAKVPSCTQGGGPFCCGPLELHVVDPATANRRFTLGGPTCVVAGPPTPAGVVCEDTPGFTNLHEVNWTGGVFGTFQIQGPGIATIAPDGNFIALQNNGGTTNVLVAVGINMLACEWIDGTHLLSGGDPQHQPLVGVVPSATVTPVQAQGDCGGRIPGGL